MSIIVVLKSDRKMTVESERKDMRTPGKTMRKTADRYRRRTGRLTAVLLALTLLGTSTVWAGEWQQLEDGNWKYEENAEPVTGWIQDEGIWYYLEPDTGLWNPRPALTETSACRLLENAVNRAGWYSNEMTEKVYKVDGSTKNTITVSIMLETAPMVVTGTLNTFDIDLRSGTAKSQQTKLVLDLYE